MEEQCSTCVAERSKTRDSEAPGMGASLQCCWEARATTGLPDFFNASATIWHTGPTLGMNHRCCQSTSSKHDGSGLGISREAGAQGRVVSMQPGAQIGSAPKALPSHMITLTLSNDKVSEMKNGSVSGLRLIARPPWSMLPLGPC